MVKWNAVCAVHVLNTNTYTKTLLAYRPHREHTVGMVQCWQCVTIKHNTVCPACVRWPSVQTRQWLPYGGTINNQDSGLSFNRKKETKKTIPKSLSKRPFVIQLVHTIYHDPECVVSAVQPFKVPERLLIYD